ncbi:MAG: sigma-54-dependent Fis family transcriptional regulator [Bacteroidia bacterium]|nr:sigma-54-dependent Fis family transcriptional regulator [Bacteroidia bacterium]
MYNILVIDDDVDICNLLDRFLSRNGFNVQTAFSSSTAYSLIEKNYYDVVLSDFRLGNTDGKDILEKVKQKDPTSQVIIITGYSDIKVAVDVIKLGAFDYITKPLLPDEILLLLNKALHKKEELNNQAGNEVVEKSKTVRKESTEKGSFISGVSRQAKEVEKQIILVAPTNYSVIIYGESGTGKESIANAIHKNSLRKNKNFVSIDCGALTKELAGSELFGHEKGSFTGALNQKIGQFEVANGGTIFLDEIANLPYDTQVALLRVVQERKLRRIGGTKEIDIDIRIIVASNEKLTEAISRGKFREDLYHRFNEFSIHLYPLRERGKDIELFANHFLRLANEELGKNITGFSPEVIEVFKSYRWPGNLRELNNIIKRVALLTDGEDIQLNSLPHEISFQDKFSFNLESASQKEDTVVQPHSGKSDLKSVALSAEYKTIVEVLKQVNYNKSKAAKLLEIDRKTLYNKLKQYQLL